VLAGELVRLKCQAGKGFKNLLCFSELISLIQSMYE